MVASIILIIIIIVLSGILIYQYKINSETYDFNGIEINKKVFDGMAEMFSENSSVIGLCRFEDNKCVPIDLRGGIEWYLYI